MDHHFDTTIAKEYGIDVAVFIKNLDFWIAKNKANKKHFHDGRYWTYNSMKAFEELFEYLSYEQIRRILRKLKDEGVIMDGNYNNSKYDRTKWYAFTDEFIESHGHLLSSSDSDQNQLGKRTNGCEETNEPIPYSKPVKNPDNNIIEYKKGWKDTIEGKMEEAFLSRLPDRSMYNYPRERKALKSLSKMTAGHEDQEVFLGVLMSTFERLRQKGNTFWQSQPFLPSVLSSQGIYPRVVEQMNKGARQEQKACDQYDEMYEEVMCEST